MKKLFLAVLICTITAVSLMGCGKKAGTEHAPGEEHPHTEHPK